MAADRVGRHPLRLYECAAKRADLRDRGYDHVIAAFDNRLKNHGVRMDAGFVLRRHGCPLVGETTPLQKAGQRRSRLTVALLILVVASALADDFDALREEFLASVNAARTREGAAPLAFSGPLARLAQQFAEKAARHRDIANVDQAEAVARAEKAGYSPKAMAEVFAHAAGSVEEVTGFLREHGGATWRNLMGEGFRDIGVGVAVIDDVPLYVFVLGVSWEDYTAGRAEEYRDLPAMRREMLEHVNTERRRRALPPLRPTPVLDRIAQAYAEDMLKRSFYGHNSPEGGTVRERAIAAGYRLTSVGENVASGQPTIEEVMDGWMASDKHRANVLSKVFTEAGFGLAIGKNRSGYQMIWVQVFGRPRVPI